MVEEGVELGFVFVIPVLNPCWEDTYMTPNGNCSSDTNLADSVASRGLFKPASKWISILPPLDFVNLSSIIPDVCFRLRRGASSTTNMESVSVHQTVRVHIKEHATAT